MAKKLNSMPDYQARMPKQPHDLGQGYTFTSAPAMLLPLYYDMLHLGDVLHFDANLFSRLNPVAAPALGKIDIHLDYFFVPLSVIYTPAPSLFYQTDDLLSSNIKNYTLVKDSFPKYDINGTIQQWKDDGFTLADNCVMFKTPDGTVRYLPNLIFECYGKSVHRMLDLFDYQPNAIFDTNVYKNPSSTPWFLCSYQAAYQLSGLYRNDDRELKNYHYNLDSYYASSTPFVDSSTDKPLFALNYADRPRDYFNAVKVSPIASSVSMLRWNSGQGGPVSVDWSRMFQPVDEKDRLTATPMFVGNPSRNSANPSTNADVSTQVLAMNGSFGGGSISTQQVRQMFAFEKLLRTIGRAEKNYESQFLAHFGVKIPHDVLHNITHIGHDMATLQPTPILSQAETFDAASGTGAALGEVSGQGVVGFHGKKRSFKAPCHGVFLCIAHWMPRYAYESGINKLHDLSSPLSFWQPEYDRLGMQQLYEFEGNKSAFGNGYPYGWQYRYEQFKRKYDRVSSAFASPTNVTGNVNTYSPWVISTKPFGYRDVQTGLMTQYSPSLVWSFKGAPVDINNMMRVPYDPRWSDDYNSTNYWLIYQTDPFINNFFMNCTKVNYMSEFGEPEL